jgi:hypothetical protein
MTKTAEIALSLVEPLLKKGHTLWMNNFYNSPALTQRLKSLNINCVGTLRLNRKDIPKTVAQFSSKFKYPVENHPTAQYEKGFKCLHIEGLMPKLYLEVGLDKRRCIVVPG